MGSDTVSKEMVSELKGIIGHPAGVPENYLIVWEIHVCHKCCECESKGETQEGCFSLHKAINFLKMKKSVTFSVGL